MNIYSYGHFKILSDEDINENLRYDLSESMHRRFERAIANPITIDYDGSGFMTLEPLTSFVTLPTTTQSSQSTTSTTTTSVYFTSAPMTAELSTITSTQTTTTTQSSIWIIASYSTLSATTLLTSSGVTSTEATTFEMTSRSIESNATDHTFTTTSVSMTSEIITNTLTSEVTLVSIPNTMSTQRVLITTDPLTSTDVLTPTTTIPPTIAPTTTSTSTTTTTTTTSISTSTTTTTSTSTSTSTAITTTTSISTTTTTTTTSTSTSTTTTTSTSTSTSTAITTTTSTSTTTTTATTSTSTSTTTTTTTSTSTSITTTTITSTSTTITTTTTMSSSSTDSPCSNSNNTIWWNNTCTSKSDVQIYTVNALRNLTNNATAIADLLSSYIDSITSSNTIFNDNNTLKIVEIDSILAKINHSSLIRNTTGSILIVQTPYQLANITVLGASFTNGIGGTIVQNTNLNTSETSQYTASAITNNQSLTDVSSLSMLIIGDPSAYRNIDQSSNRTLASSIIVASVKRNSSSPLLMNISLSFRVLDQWKPNSYTVDYFCSFYDTNTSHWNESGCTKPVLNANYNRYECSCNHLTSFALLWSLTPPFNPDTCPDTNTIRLTNGTCVLKSDGAVIVVNTLRNPNNTNSTATAQELTIYFSSISNSNASSNSDIILKPSEIDDLVYNLTNISFAANTTSSFIIAQQPIQPDNRIVLGASFVHNRGGSIVDNSNQYGITNSLISTAAIVSEQSLIGVTSLNMLIIDNPSIYRTIDNSSNKTLASSVIVAAIRRNTPAVDPINISLYFQVLPGFEPNSTDVDYYCSFLNLNTSRWDESGCTIPTFNKNYARHECSCNHLTSFALIWLPKGSLTSYLNAQDIASLVFQSISILCFLAVITHALFIRLRDPLMSLQAYDLLPLISSASTTLLFIFYIALGMTVYTRTASVSQTECFTSSSVLMFIVYFFVIFMFCTKTSVGYFNYLRFVYLFPQPRFRKLLKMLIVSFFVSMAWVSFAIGFNSSSSFRITQLYPYKLCWFTRPALYYFLTIPVCIFVLFNIILFVLIAYRIINHVRHATSPHQTFERMKRCVLVLLSSCLSQGIGWLLGPVLSFVDPTAGEVLGWFFIIFNGLEGLWSILLYVIIRSKLMDLDKRVIAAKALETVKTPKRRKYKMSSGNNIDENKIHNKQKTTVANEKWVQDQELSNTSDDQEDTKDRNYSTNTFNIKNDDLIEFSF